MKNPYTWKIWFILITGFIITFLTSIYVKSEIDKRNETEFRFECKNITSKIETRLHANAQLLRSGAAFFAASDNVRPEEWKKFIEHYKVDQNLPGILGTGFSLKIPKDKLDEHIQKIRNEGFPEYVVWPENEREIYTSIVCLEPFSGINKKAFGYDMMSEPVRKEAMERARDMDVASLSGKVHLVQEGETDVQAGNLMYVPVYKKGIAINSVEQRRAALKGWVYSPYRMNDLISGILNRWELEDNLNKYYLSIYDGVTPSSESLLFESHYSEDQIISNKMRFTLNLPIDFNGHHWTLVFTQAKGNFFIDYLGVWGVLVGGFIISMLLFFLTRSLNKTQYNAQKIAEKLTVELKERESRLSTIIEVSPIPIILTKMNNGEIIMVNASLVKFAKLPLDEIIGRNTLDLYPNKVERDLLLNAVLKDGYVDNFELELKNGFGELFWCSMSTKLITLDEEEVLVTGFQDITKRKKAEAELLEHRQHLEEMVEERTRELTISEQKLRQSLKVISDYKLALDESSLVAITDNKGIINSANDKFCKVSQYTRDELIGSTHSIINSGYHPREFFINLWSTISKGKVWRGEIKNKAKDGSYYWVDSTIIPFLGNNGKPYQYVSVRFEVTKRKSAEDDLIKEKEKADSANRAKSEFLANMSHEIRTPMNAVIGFSELLSKSVQDKKQRSQVDSIRSSGKNLLKIINDILDLSKIEAGKIDIIPTPVNLRYLLSEIEKMFLEKVKEKGITFTIEYENVITKTLLLDEVRMRQILFNLIGNAVKFTNKGYVILNIDYRKNSEKEDNVDLTVLVKDTGIGIPADQQELIFDPFSQQSGQNLVKYGGTGLGLSITKKLVEKMGGSINLKSEVGKGSTFNVDLPNIPVLNTDVDAKQNAFDTSTVIFKPATILIADDKEENRNLIIDVLEKSPLTILQAINGEEAVDMAKKYFPDLILMDIRMQGMDGYEATEILKNDKLTKSIPIMAITASIKSSNERDNISKLFDEYLLKPLDIKQFFDKLKKYLKYDLTETNSSPDNYSTGKPEYKLSEELKQKIPGFIETLELEFMPEYEKAIKNQVINEMEKFGLDLLLISQKINCKIMIDYSNEINAYAENFDFEKLIQTLRKFPELVLWLKHEIKRV